MATDPNLLMHLVNAPGLAAQNVFAGQNSAMEQAQARQGLQINQFKLAGAQRQMQQEQAYQADVADFLTDPSPARLLALTSKYPEQADSVRKSWDLKDKAQKSADMGQLGAIYSALSNKRPDLAIAQLKQRRDAEKARGVDTADIDHAIEGLQKGDETAANTLKGFVLSQLAAADPERFTQIYGAVGEDAKGFTLSPGAKRFDAEGKLIAEAPFAPRPVTVGEGQTVVEYNPNPGGGDPASGGDTIGRMLEITPFTESGNREFNPDGSRVTSPKGARGIMQVMPKTAGDPGYGIKPSNGTPAEDARLGKQYLAKMLDIYGNPAQAWAAYNAGPGAVDQAIKKGGDRWLQQMPKETQQYVARNMSQLRGGGSGGPRVIAQGAPKQDAAPSGYRWAPDGNLEPIPGGPGDKAARGGTADPKAEGMFRREFNTLPEVKDFKDVRASFQQIRTLATKRNPSPADDIALVFSYMKMLDPGSVVREGEFATAQNAAGIPDQVRNAYNKALSGNRLNPVQRGQMASAAAGVYQSRRSTYNSVADRYRAMADDYGYDPGRIAPLALTAEELNQRRAERGLPPVSSGRRDPARVRSVQEAMRLPKGTLYVAPDGKVRRR